MTIMQLWRTNLWHVIFLNTFIAIDWLIDKNYFFVFIIYHNYFIFIVTAWLFTYFFRLFISHFMLEKNGMNSLLLANRNQMLSCFFFYIIFPKQSIGICFKVIVLSCFCQKQQQQHSNGLSCTFFICISLLTGEL